MIRMILAGAMALALSACAGQTSQERQDFADAGLATAKLAVERVQEVAGNPLDASPEVLSYARLACDLLDIGSPLLITAINRLVDERNAEAAEDEAAEDEQIAPVTVAEFQSTLAGACDVVEAVLAQPAPVASVLPVPRPA